MTLPIRIGVGAYIIRPSEQGFHQLLLFHHPDCEEAPIQIPGGGVEPGETIAQALQREIFEETGLRDVTIVRKLGIAEDCWIHPRKLISQRHIFLLKANSETPETWEHAVQGDGIDAGTHFSYFWHRPTADFSLPGDLGFFLYPQWVPELYDRPSPER